MSVRAFSVGVASLPFELAKRGAYFGAGFLVGYLAGQVAGKDHDDVVEPMDGLGERQDRLTVDIQRLVDKVETLRSDWGASRGHLLGLLEAQHLGDDVGDGDNELRLQHDGPPSSVRENSEGSDVEGSASADSSTSRGSWDVASLLAAQRETNALLRQVGDHVSTLVAAQSVNLKVSDKAPRNRKRG